MQLPPHPLLDRSMKFSRTSPMTRTLLAAVLLALAMALTGLGSAPPPAVDKRLDAMIGQMIMVGFLGDNERDPGVKAVRDQLANGIVGGVVLYPENIGSTGELRTLTARIGLEGANADVTPRDAVVVTHDRLDRTAAGR